VSTPGNRENFVAFLLTVGSCLANRGQNRRKTVASCRLPFRMRQLATVTYAETTLRIGGKTAEEAQGTGALARHPAFPLFLGSVRVSA
jgi:hypothetical protein